MTPRSMFCLRRATAYNQFQRISQSHLKRYISQQNRALPPTLHPTLTRAESPTAPFSAQTVPRRRPSVLNFTTSAATQMASDEDYMAFLDKANRDPNEGYAKPQSDSNEGFKAMDDGATIPAAIQEATKDAFYVSDADEPFVPVCLAWDEAGKGLPDEEEFAALIHHPSPFKAEIEIQDPADWDTQGQYAAIVDAVRKAGKGNDVRVYRVAKGGVKVEYWVVTTDGKGKGARLVGAKALAVES
ncbi:hypothetical protein F5Y10DRAFT_242499 [Nemania abortiva]|nr:hypothetical protein F5Y10DRAFT_242499 [Nemania abortiva]